MAKCPKPRNLVCKLEPTRYKMPAMGSLTGPCRAVVIARELIGDMARESMLALYLSAKHCPIAYDVFTSGGISSVEIEPGAIVRGAVMVGAAALITVHNHPSGDADASDADRRVWRELSARCECLSIKHLDDIVIGEDGFFSRSEGRVRPFSHCAGETLEGWRSRGGARSRKRW